MIEKDDSKIEIIDLPQEGEFKVIQMLFDGKLIMLCGYNDHYEILENFLRQNGIPPERTIIKTLLGEKEIPKITGDRYTIMGMGRSKINTNARKFQLPYDSSIDYNIGPNYTFRKQLERQFEDWKLGTI